MREIGGDESEEGRKYECQKCEEMPGKMEVELHNKTHFPYRSWCPHCVKGQGSNPPHLKTEKEEQKYPVISLDYYY